MLYIRHNIVWFGSIVYVKILPIKLQKNCCASPNKTQVLGLKQRCTDRTVCDINRQHFWVMVLMSNKSCCFVFLLKQCCCCKVIPLQLCCWVLKQVWFIFLPYHDVYSSFTIHSVSMLMNVHTDVCTHCQSCVRSLPSCFCGGGWGVTYIYLTPYVFNILKALYSKDNTS